MVKEASKRETAVNLLRSTMTAKARIKQEK